MNHSANNKGVFSMGKVFIHKPLKRAELRRALAPPEPTPPPVLRLVPDAPDKEAKRAAMLARAEARKKARDPMENSLRGAKHIRVLFDRLDLTLNEGVLACASVIGNILHVVDEDEFEEIVAGINKDMRDAYAQRSQ
jgi:hypothetical protein